MTKPKKKRKRIINAWAIRRKSDDDISNKLFETKHEAMDAMTVLPNCYFNVVRVEIRIKP